MRFYTYTTETYQLKGWLKVGQTTKTVQSRVNQQDNSSNPEELIFVDLGEVIAGLYDFHVHSVLRSRGKHIRKEWFNTTEKEVREIISDLEKSNNSLLSFRDPTTSGKADLTPGFEVDDFCIRKETELGLRYLARGNGNGTNDEKAVGTALKRKYEYEEDEGFVVFWPRIESNLTEEWETEIRNKYQAFLSPAGITMVFMKEKDYRTKEEYEQNNIRNGS